MEQSHDSSSGTINEIKPKHTSYNNRNQKTSTNKNTRTHVQVLNAHDAVPKDTWAKSDVVVVIKRVDTATKRDTSQKCVLVKQNKTIWESHQTESETWMKNLNKKSTNLNRQHMNQIPLMMSTSSALVRNNRYSLLTLMVPKYLWSIDSGASVNVIDEHTFNT